jgi:hypothetical protein
MGVMGTPTTRATNYLHARRLSDIVRSVVTQFGAHEMIAELKSLLVSIFWGCAAIGALFGYVAIAMYTVGPR